MEKYDIKNRTKRAISIEGRRTPLAPGETIAAVHMPDDRAARYAATPAHFEIKPHAPNREKDAAALPRVVVRVGGQDPILDPCAEASGDPDPPPKSKSKSKAKTHPKGR